MLVHEYIGRKLKEDGMGLELETEAEVPLPVSDIPKPWRAKAEGSLRGLPGCSVEYYSEGVVPADEWKLPRIRRLTDMLNKPEQKVLKESPRTSFHVHVNMLHRTPAQVWAAACAYWILENLLVKYCGPLREGNMFCLRLRDAEAILTYAKEDVLADHPFHSLNNNHIRYAGVNLNALAKFGTLEFRSMRGTTDPTILDNWSTAMYHLVNEAVKMGNPENLLDFYFRNSEATFINRFIHPNIRPEIERMPNIRDDMDDSALMLGDFAYLVDWPEWETQLETLWNAAQYKPRIYRDDALDAFVARIRPEFIAVDEMVRAGARDAANPAMDGRRLARQFVGQDD